MFRIVSLVFVFILTIVFVSELPIRKGFLKYKLYGTQYEKLLWFEESIGQKYIYNNKFKYCFIGSSSTLYGIVDSICAGENINLGLNTHSNEMELYLLEKLYNAGNKVDFVVLEKSNNELTFGLHPVLHYVCKPSWLIKNGQRIIQPHFLLFILKRAQIVAKSWLFFQYNSVYSPNFTKYGHRKLNQVISKKRFDEIANQTLLDATKQQNAFLWNLRHNYLSKPKFIKNLKNLITVNKSIVISLEAPSPFRKNVISFKYFQNDTIELGDIAVNYIYWADPGHLNGLGSILYTKRVLSELSN